MQVTKDVKLAVIGAGSVGMSIIEAFAQQGFNVTGVELNQEVIDRAMARVNKSLDRLVERGKLTAEDKAAIIGRIHMTTDFNALRDMQVVIEAIFENMEVKKTLFKKLDETVAQDSLLLTNTSSLSVSEIASATGRPGQVAGMHFFNPVPIMKLVEVVRGVESSDDTVATVVELSKLMGKTPIVCKDSPGFVVNRLLHMLAIEASRIVEEGVATAMDVDTGAKLGLGHPMGPFEVFDFLDSLPLFKTVCDYLEQEMGERFKLPVWVKNYVRAGRVGRVTGKGFHEYNK